jgi:hypothetical protein
VENASVDATVATSLAIIGMTYIYSVLDLS